MPKLDSHLRREVQDYLKESGATKEERATVWQMVHEGYDYLSNPWFYALWIWSPRCVLAGIYRSGTTP